MTRRTRPNETRLPAREALDALRPTSHRSSNSTPPRARSRCRRRTWNTSSPPSAAPLRRCCWGCGSGVRSTSAGCSAC